MECLFCGMCRVTGDDFGKIEFVCRVGWHSSVKDDTVHTTSCFVTAASECLGEEVSTLVGTVDMSDVCIICRARDFVGEAEADSMVFGQVPECQGIACLNNGDASGIVFPIDGLDGAA